MSITTSHSRSSIELGECQPSERPLNQNSRIHPARLQHSPSLPNIWIPPHSSPVPPDMMKSETHLVIHPSAPSSPKLEPLNTERATRHVKYASVDPDTRKSLAPKTHARRRTERDQPHKLLTPPLTPSSSIRTTDSREDVEALTVSGEILDHDPQSTRILLLEHVDGQIPISNIESAILEALAMAQAETALDRDPSSTIVPPLKRNEIIRATNDRLRSEGKVPVVFFDIRIARTAQDILSTSYSDHLQRYASDRLNESGDPLAVSARLAPVEDVVEILGKSVFLDSIDGSFSIKVQRVSQALTTEASAASQVELQNGESDGCPDPDDSSFMLSGINISVLLNILKSYGSVRTLQYTGKEIEDNGLTSLVYRVEYHDSREAGISYAELPGQAIFGIKISTFGKVIASDQAINSSGPESPPVFYDSSTTFASNETGQPIYYDQFPPPPLDIPQSITMVQPPGFQLQHWEDMAYRPNPVSPCYTPEGICQYCPSRGGVNGPDYYAANGLHHYVPAPTPTLYFPTHVNAQLLPVTPGPSVYDFVDSQMHPLANAGPWGFDPAIAAIGKNISPSEPMPHTTPSATVRPSPQSVPHVGGGRPQPRHANTSNRHAMRHSAQPLDNSRGRALSPKHQNDIATHRSSSPSSYGSNGLEKCDVSNSPPGAPNDRNQLNLAKISEGGDTRTTIMIKNIPNKMSDLDLTEYIGEVCPRKIDFLYLRMDFKNACNVGYAFVNFIDVKDLLHFARERLGVKWNMFKSDKVLQMSYANYQGKEALVEKFKNSSIMDEPEHWRPRIFYSSGVNQGLLEPFPAPTHIRRKERSSYNRGTLFPPGVNSHTNGQSHGLLHNTNRRYHNDARPQEGRSGFTGGRPNHHLFNSRNGADEGTPRWGRGDEEVRLFRSADH